MHLHHLLMNQWKTGRLSLAVSAIPGCCEPYLVLSASSAWCPGLQVICQRNTKNPQGLPGFLLSTQPSLPHQILAVLLYQRCQTQAQSVMREQWRRQPDHIPNSSLCNHFLFPLLFHGLVGIMVWHFLLEESGLHMNHTCCSKQMLAGSWWKFDRGSLQS